MRPEGGSFQYYPDSRLKFATDYLSNARSGGRQDRSYAYDHAGRLLKSLTGTDARNFIGGTASNVNDGPYRQAFTYDEWGNQLSKGGLLGAGRRRHRRIHGDDGAARGALEI